MLFESRIDSDSSDSWEVVTLSEPWGLVRTVQADSCRELLCLIGVWVLNNCVEVLASGSDCP